MDIARLALGRRIETCLRCEGIETVEQLIESDQLLHRIPNLGKESIARLLDFFMKLNKGEIRQELEKLSQLSGDAEGLRKLVGKAEKYDRIVALIHVTE